MSQLEFFLVVALIGMIVALVSWGMCHAMVNSAPTSEIHVHAIIKTFPVPFLGTVALAWLNQFKRRRMGIATMWMCLAGTVPVWGWLLGNELWDLLRKMQ